MNKIDDYFIARRFDVASLSADVNTRLKNGWNLLGSAFTANENGAAVYCQVIVKIKSDKPLDNNVKPA